MAQTQRIEYPAERGIVDTNLQWPAVRSDSFVAATVSELRVPRVNEGGRDASRFIGAASLSILNVACHDGGVTVRVDIAWEHPLEYAVDFILFD
jgi:hypothetical protein